VIAGESYRGRMKTVLALIVTLAFATGAVAQSAPQTTPPAKKDDAKKVDPRKADTKKDDAKKKKEEPPPKIEGVQIPRPDGRILAIRVVDGVFRLSFYDAKKKPMAPDIAKAALRWNNKNKLGDERTLLTPGGDDHSLTSSKIIRPPLSFKLYISLLTDSGSGEDVAAESYVIDFAQQ
jgi:hypothetical protein